MEPAFSRSSELLSAPASQLVIVDVQERLTPQIADSDAVVGNCSRLIRGAAIFDVPVVITEQYPSGLGPTIPALSQLLSGRNGDASLNDRSIRISEKLRFSAADATGWPAAGERDDGRHQVVLAGLETHICVLQTALDLLSQGYRVFVAADATGSRRPFDRDIARNRLRDSGVIVTTVESVLFEWCEVAGTERFRQLRDFVTDR
ncbi:MAG: hydrolase [Planctomycetaceae bacterium]